MTQRRFILREPTVDDTIGCSEIFDNGEWITYGEITELLNELNDENKRLKQYTKQVLQNHLDGWRGVYNPIDESLVVEINVVKSIAEDLGVDLE